MEYEKNIIEFANGPIISVTGKASSFLKFVSVQRQFVDFKCARCGREEQYQQCDYDEEGEMWYFDCPKCNLHYKGEIRDQRMQLYARWMEYNPQTEE